MLSMRVLLLCLLPLFAVSLANVETDERVPRVKIPLGGIKGTYKISANGRQYEAYEGIPYALPPIGKYRFRSPRPIPAWHGELAANKFGSKCLQYTQIPIEPHDRVEGAEDCLYLNIYVPVREELNGARTPPMPVLFWIHGGAFQFGSGMDMGAKFLMDHDVIFVTINYRLGPLGFLSTEDEVVPGNMGLKDQSMALRFVSDNIEWFGGNPKKITLVGLSAGGASVHYHYLSPLSAGLFQGGISVSGTTFDCWTQTENSLEKAKKLGALMGCPTTTTKDMVQCLRYRPSRALVQALGEFMVFHFNPFTPFGPVVEKFGDAPFINQSPADIVSSGAVQDVPWITSVTSEEGLWPVAEFYKSEEALKKLDVDWELLAPHYLDYNNTLPKEKHSEVAKLVKEHYFGTEPISSKTIKQLIQLSSDRFFVHDAVKAAKMQAKVNKQPVWFYYYSYRATDSLSDAMSGTKENHGVSHADDAYLVVDTVLIDPTKTDSDIAMQQKLINLWVSFATKGVPNVNGAHWDKVDPAKKELQYLHIASPNKIHMDNNANLGDNAFWDTIGLNENKVTVTPNSHKEEL